MIEQSVEGLEAAFEYLDTVEDGPERQEAIDWVLKEARVLIRLIKEES